MLKRKAKRFFATLLSLALVLSMGMTASAEPNEGNNYETTDTLETNYPGEAVYTYSWLFGHVNAFTLEGNATFSHLVGPAITKGAAVAKGGMSNFTNGVSSYIYGPGLGVQTETNNSREPFLCPPLYLGKSYKVTYNGNRYYAGGTSLVEGGRIYTTDNYIDWDKATSSLKAESLALYENASKDASTIHITADTPMVDYLSGFRGYEVKVGTTVIIEDSALDKINNEGLFVYISGNYESKTPTVINVPKSGEWKMPGMVVYDQGKTAIDSDQLGDIYNYPEENKEYLEAEKLSPADATVDFNREGTSVVWNIVNATKVTYPNVSNSYGHIFAPNTDFVGNTGSSDGGFICKSVFLDMTELHMFPMGGSSSVTPPPAKPNPINTDVTLNKLLYENKVGGTALTQTAGEFQFELTGIAGTNTEGKTFSAANDAGGVAKFTLTHDAEGEYRYTLTEKNLGADKTTYDTTVYNVLITVTEADGKLNAVISFTDAAGNAVAADKVVFNNVRATVEDPGKKPEDDKNTTTETDKDKNKKPNKDKDKKPSKDKDSDKEDESDSDKNESEVKTDRSAATADEGDIFLGFTLMIGAVAGAITLQTMKRRNKKEEK